MSDDVLWTTNHQTLQIITHHAYQLYTTLHTHTWNNCNLQYFTIIHILFYIIIQQ